MAKASRITDSLVAFRNSQGEAAQGTLLHLSRHVAVFEVYNPYSIVQLSEVLQDVRVRRAGRDIYRGRAVVTNLVNTGLMLIVSASLVEPWSDMYRLDPGPMLRDEVRTFVADWRGDTERLLPEYLIAVAHFRNFLLELSRWLDHGETLAGISSTDSNAHVEDFVRDVDVETRDQFVEAFGRFETAASQVSRRDLPMHRAFAQRELHPVILCAPFMHRTFSKPLGYAGDYQMVNMMLGEPLQGTNTFAKILNAAAIRADAPQAHRNRISILQELIHQEAIGAKQLSRPLRLLNIGCGPAVELTQLLRDSAESNVVDATLMDFNEETLAYAQSQIAAACLQFDRKAQFRYQLRSVNDLIQDAMRSEVPERPAYDLVYCAGLFDYFGDPTCEALIDLFLQWTRPGGLVVVTNVTPNHSTVGLMSHLLEWNLKLRDAEQMRVLIRGPVEAQIVTDATGVNVFLMMRKWADSEANGS